MIAPLIPSLTKKGCQNWTPSDKTFWIRACLNAHAKLSLEDRYAHVLALCGRSAEALTVPMPMLLGSITTSTLCIYVRRSRV